MSSTAPVEVSAAERIQKVKSDVAARDPNQAEFLQAFYEIVDSIEPVLLKHPKYIDVMRSIVEPERVIQFRVNWTDDKGDLHTNRGFRVQYNSALGPYKGGLRLHPSVCLSILKFLGFEQIFKNSLTGLAMGGGKGGSDFDPKGKSDSEVRNFCQSFMTELSRHIGPDTDVPAGDIGVGGREIGYLFGQYKRLRNEFTGTLTGKGASWGGSLCRPEATGYGAVYFAQHMMKDAGSSLAGKRCCVSGSGNAAQYTCEKLIQLKALVCSVSDSNGCLEYTKGMTADQLKRLLVCKNEKRQRLSQLAQEETDVVYHEGKRPWFIKCDLAFPSATQNEVEKDDVENLAKNGCTAVVEVANMPSTAEAIKAMKTHKILYAPGKAANAGGVAVSGMEMAQNSARKPWSFDEVDQELQKVMHHIYHAAKDAAKEYGCEGDLQVGANIAGFLKVANAMIDQGLF